VKRRSFPHFPFINSSAVLFHRFALSIYHFVTLQPSLVLIRISTNIIYFNTFCPKYVLTLRIIHLLWFLSPFLLVSIKQKYTLRYSYRRGKA
jgi:hypothetical protein